MKKSLLFTFFFMGLSGLGWAQVTWGVQAGLSLSYLLERTEGTPTMDENKLLVGPSLGVDALVPVYEQRLWLRSGLRLLSAGEANEIGTGGEFTPIRLWYSQLPLDLAFRLTPSLEFRGGIWGGLLVGHNLTIDDLSRVDGGWACGFSWIINPHWEFGLRYGQSLVDVYDARKLIFESDPEELKIGVRNQLMGVFITYFWAAERPVEKK